LRSPFPSALLFAAICLDLIHIPANLLSLGALDFGMVVDGSVVMIENIVRHLSSKDDPRTPTQKIRDAAHEVQRPVFFARGIIIASYLPIFTLQAVEGRLFKPMAWTVTFALIGALVFAILVAPVMGGIAFQKGAKEWKNPMMEWLTGSLSHRGSYGHRAPQHHAGNCDRPVRSWPLPCPSAGRSVRSFCPISTRAPSGCAERCHQAKAPRRASTSPTRRGL
jgi:multidrug efflux pump subunit AcrB